MKLQYLGDSRDSFKWDYHHYLVPALGAKELQIIWMRTKDDIGTHGQTRAELFPARQEILKFCSALKAKPDFRKLDGLPALANAKYGVRQYGTDCCFSNKERRTYFEGVEPSRGIILLDPDNGFEPERSCSEKHVGYGDIERLAGRMPPSTVISVFQHFRRKPFPDDFARIQERLHSGLATAIYWHSLMFVLITKSEEMRKRVRRVNCAYAEERLMKGRQVINVLK
ncbi:MAG: hypothetical protein KF776_09010 [Burkholderiales bacterium]|nr:hypothetical protein [Burkholderiales bacterium]